MSRFFILYESEKNLNISLKVLKVIREKLCLEACSSIDTPYGPVNSAGCFPRSQWGGEQEQGVRGAPARGSHKSGPFCPLCPPNQQGLDDPNSWGLIHQVAP